MENPGANLLRAVEVLQAFEIEMEALKDELSAMLSKATIDGLRLGDEKEDTDSDDYFSQEGWLLLGWRWTFPARGKNPEVAAPRTSATSPWSVTSADRIGQSRHSDFPA